jgi:hypothetical protein
MAACFALSVTTGSSRASGNVWPICPRSSFPATHGASDPGTAPCLTLIVAFYSTNNTHYSLPSFSEIYDRVSYGHLAPPKAGQAAATIFRRQVAIGAFGTGLIRSCAKVCLFLCWALKSSSPSELREWATSSPANKKHCGRKF